MISNIKRKFIIGDEWFFFKVYTGVKTADSLLINHFMPIINIWKDNSYISKWFFIRYYDPEFHLRIRVLLTDKENIMPIINDLNVLLTKLIQQNLIWKLQTDTYTRELERYGAERIEDIETIFFNDSEMITETLNYIENTDSQNTRWLVGLSIIDSLLDVFKVSIENKKVLMEIYVAFFSAEMNYDKYLKRQLSLKYRKNKKDINNFLSKKTEHFQLINLISQKNKKTEKIVNKILNQKLSFENLGELIFSISHMSLNRLYRTKSRENEFVSYHLLLYYYESKIAQLKHQKQIDLKTKKLINENHS
jgi:thiopeptide-type bacteriocin biosynthesis protein